MTNYGKTMATYGKHVRFKSVPSIETRLWWLTRSVEAYSKPSEGQARE